MNQDLPSVIPDTRESAARDKLNNVLTGISLKSGLLQMRVSDSQLRAELRELEELALEAVVLTRELHDHLG